WSGGVATYAEPGPIRRYMELDRRMPFRGWCRPQTEVSAAAGLANLAVAADPSRLPADRLHADRLHAGAQAGAHAAWRYVRRRQRADGSWDSYWWTSPHFATRQAVALALGVGDLAPVRRAAAWALRGQRHDGTWGAPGAAASPFATALSLLVLTDAGLGDDRPIIRGTEALVRLQQADGTWPSHPVLRIPLPADRSTSGDGRWRPIRFDTGITVPDQHRLFTSATCLAALARALRVTDDAS
ncbi:hypothetical protein ABZW03_34135, partial [Kitasatospora sp. NPDC004799]